MKLEDLKINIKIGANKSKYFYVVRHVFKDSIFNEIKELTELKIFSGDYNQQYIDNNQKIIYIGLGEKEKITIHKIASIYIKLGEQITKWNGVGLQIELEADLTEKISISSLVYQIANSLYIGSFPVNILSKSYKEKMQAFNVGEITFLVSKKEEEVAIESLKKAKIVSKYLNNARLVAHLPANHFTPQEFVSRSKEIAKLNKLKITIFDEKRLEKEGFEGILSVGKGSNKDPKMILLEYNPKNSITKKKLVLVGKGLTFDSGGISIKPSADMHEMKYDMCGAAAVIHAIGAIAEMNIPVPVVAAIGVAENMPDANATKPGDVYTAYNGVTVEVQNTDAEGRLVLGDVLAYVCKHYKPEYLVDLATLTGAVIIALGNEAAGLMSNSTELTKFIKQASEQSGDKVWELPLWDEYANDLESDIADVKNITGGKGAGTLSAAQFLKKFIEENTKWAHLDIAGVAWRSKGSGTQCSGVTGYGIRLLTNLAETIAQNSKE